MAHAEPERPVDQVMLERMTESLHHRGPDSRGFHIAPGVGLGITRLSIIDIETGDQPIANEDGTLVLVCNGEIYNQRELRERLIAGGHRFRTQSDVEVIVHLYEDHGVECLQYLRGMFALALWDAPRNRLLLARDRLGIKPLHYSLAGDACYFGSEQKAILATDRIERRLDVHALADLFTLGLTRTPKTFLTEIRRLPPAHYLLYEDGKATLHEYWDLDFSPREEVLKPADWAEALLEQLNESVRLHLMSDVPVGAWLSAGLDSSAIVALMSRQTEQAIDTFTLGFEHADFDEGRSGRMLHSFPSYNLTSHRSVCTAQDIGLLPKALWHCEDPLASVSEIPRMLLSASSAERVKVVLTGEGADEIFGGYDYFRIDKALRPLARLPSRLRRLIGAAGSSRHPRASRVHVGPSEMRMERYARLTAPLNISTRFLSADVRRLLEGSPDGGIADLRLPERFAGWHPFSQLQYYETKIRLPDRIELSLDRASMAFSLEARVPFLDHKLVEFCARIPPSLKMRGLQEKYILREALRDVLPAEIAQREKRPLRAPVKHWLRAPLPDFAAELLSEEQLRRTGYFDAVAVRRLRTDFDRGNDSLDRALMSVLLVQLWDHLFMRLDSER
ncbi:MAG: asparagine synthase (glutamine-hydrolyzing) [Anaerolineae bacterium]|nr:asparagine synthase (glutamine-hydrolyzing) [Gemmatimonadaceae bacterium]